MNLAKPFNHKRFQQGHAGVVYGAPGVAWNLDGTLYNDHYEAVDMYGNRLPMEAASAPPPKAQAPKPAAAPVIDPDDETDDNPDTLDLAAWAAGTLKVPFFTVRSAIASRFGKTVQSKEQAIAALKLHSVITE